jgi:hypothetical protein
MAETTAGAIAQVLEAIDALEVLGETVVDDAQYVMDLARAWRLRLNAIADNRPPVSPDQAEALELAIAEAASISDPHKAIDWLSTLPQLVQMILEAR